MSLARNPNMPYQMAGQQFRPTEKMNVRSHVHVPDAEACVDYDGRCSYAAPATVRRREAYLLSMKTGVLVVAAALFVMSMLYISAVAKRAGVYKAGQQIVDEMAAMDQQMIELKEKIASAQEDAQIRYQAAQRLGMISNQGIETIEIYAPDTRPLRAENSLSAGNVRAFLDD